MIDDFKYAYDRLALGNLKGKQRAELAMQLLHTAYDLSAEECCGYDTQPSQEEE